MVDEPKQAVAGQAKLEVKEGSILPSFLSIGSSLSANKAYLISLGCARRHFESFDALRDIFKPSFTIKRDHVEDPKTRPYPWFIDMQSNRLEPTSRAGPLPTKAKTPTGPEQSPADKITSLIRESLAG